MTERWARLERIYHEATALSEAERPDFLEQQCGDDPELRREVEAMLRHADTQYLDVPSAAVIAEPPVAGSLTGRRLGVHQVGDVIGAGGMGEVYRARDTSLGRDVAIKVLPPEWLADPGRRARFEREARVLASLNHPNIADIYELDTSTSVPALVLELVEGETLRDRILKGPIPIRELMPLARQMADALEAAHEAGVVHRDFKPENVRITPAGTIKVLDFGIATIVRDGGAEPTATAHRTKDGAILGTAPYMSPEQARGKPVDRRTDIWAFGCVLYEMLTGRRAFAGDTWSDTLAVILERDPDWQAFPASTPAALVGLIRRCLEKDPRQRLRDIGDARLELEALASQPARGESENTWSAARARRLVWLAAAGVPVAVALGIVFDRTIRAPGSPVRVTNLSMSLAPGIAFPYAASEIALAPDGRSVVYAGVATGGRVQLYMQAFDSTEATVLKGTEGGRSPFFSPDGKWLAFYSGRQLKKIALPDGPAQVISEDETLVGNPSYWASDGTILLSEIGDAHVAGIKRVSQDGGRIDVVTRPDRNASEMFHSAPQTVDGSAAILFIAGLQLPAGRKNRVMVLPAAGQQPRVLIDDATQARYVGDHILLYQRGTSVFATTLDTAAWTIGPSRSVFDGVYPDLQSPAWSHARDVFVYRPNVEDRRILTWVSRSGTEAPLPAPARQYDSPDLSPRGDRLAVEVHSASTVDAYVYDFGRDTLRPVTFDGLSRYPGWTPDGSRLTISRRSTGAGAGSNDTYWMSADGAGEAELLKRNDQLAFVNGWTRDVRTMIYNQTTAGGADVWTFDRETGQTQPLIVNAATKYGARLSSDDRWLAYVSNGTGAFELYVSSFGAPGRQWQLTTDGAREPIWSADGRELFYRHGNDVLSIPIEPGDSFVAGRPRVLFSGPYFQIVGAPGRRTYDVAPDGSRFLMMRSLPSEAPALRVVQGFAPGAAK